MKAVLDHIGIAVQDLDKALAFYRDALGLEVETPEEVYSQRVRAHFIPVGQSSIELLEATASDSAIAKYTRSAVQASTTSRYACRTSALRLRV